jgi:hypothetical protein
MSGMAGEPMVTLTLAQSDLQLVMQVLGQALLPYQRLGQVMQGMQQQTAREAERLQRSEQVEGMQRGHPELEARANSMQTMQQGEARLNRPHAIGDEPGLMRQEVRP